MNHNTLLTILDHVRKLFPALGVVLFVLLTNSFAPLV